jgi:hypothetical protein
VLVVIPIAEEVAVGLTLKEAEVPVGKPLALKVTGLLNKFKGFKVTV